MGEYQRQVNAPSLEHLASAIHDEEVGGAEFVRIAITFFEGAVTNFVTLRELQPGQRPAGKAEVLAFTAPAPAGKTLLWSGAAVIAGTNAAVAVFR